MGSTWVSGNVLSLDWMLCVPSVYVRLCVCVPAIVCCPKSSVFVCCSQIKTLGLALPPLITVMYVVVSVTLNHGARHRKLDNFLWSHFPIRHNQTICRCSCGKAVNENFTSHCHCFATQVPQYWDIKLVYKQIYLKFCTKHSFCWNDFFVKTFTCL